MICASCLVYVRNSQRDAIKSRRESASFFENEYTFVSVAAMYDARLIKVLNLRFSNR